MTRVAIVVEGQTEREFINLVLAPSLWERQVYLFPSLIGHNGGDVSVEQLASDMAVRCWNFDYVTSLVDFYGFRGKGSLSPDALEEHINEEVRKKAHRSKIQSLVFAYVQQFEFEALLFSDVSAFSDWIPMSNESMEELCAIRSKFHTPEHINDNPVTAPSKRIKSLIPNYDKRTAGPLIAESIGLGTMRAECPRFNAWLIHLESLAASLPSNP